MSMQRTTHELNELFPGQMIENGDPLEIARERTNHFRYGLSIEDHDEFYGDLYNSNDYREHVPVDFTHPLQRQACLEEWGEVIEEPEAVYEQSKRVEVIDPIVVSPIRMIYKGKFNEKRGYRRNRVKILVA